MSDKTSGELWRDLKGKGMSNRARELMDKLKDHIHHMPTRVWLSLGDGKIFMVKDEIKGFCLTFTYRDGVFTFCDSLNREQCFPEDEIIDIGGF